MIAVPMQAPTMVAGAVMCAVSLVASASPMLMKLPNLPKLPGLPKMPDLPNLPSMPKIPSFPNMPSLPFPGQGKTEAEAVAKAPVVKKPAQGRVVAKVRVGGVKVPVGSEDAPSLAEIRGEMGGASKRIAEGEGWKRFPSRRSPGGRPSLDGFRKIAKEIASVE
jgi:hypothetical protein